ncbi:hypothetical protein DH2020_043299 [Rehmannia glutinosa]|uniref:CASP-like protein n=1 Tax=Rehmannia glutinosa TaxID=99300 RepID=A0ABR0ULU7_REHGL
MASAETLAPNPRRWWKQHQHHQPSRQTVVEAPPPEEEKVAAPPPEVKTPGDAPPIDCFALAEVVLRFLFCFSLVAVVVMVTSKQTKILCHLPNSITLRLSSLSVAGLYSIITTLLSFYALLKPGCCPKVLSHFVIFDVLLLGIVAAATGTAGAVAYIGLKGNSHVGWRKICNVYDDFCKHVGASVFVSLFASIVLAFLVLLSVYALSKKIPK